MGSYQPPPLLPSGSSYFSQHPPLRNILIIGATGAIGRYITRAIINSKSHFGRICIYTSETTLMEKIQEICAYESEGVTMCTGDLDDEKNFKQSIKGIDTIISCVGRTAIEKQINLITWAEECGVRRFFASEYGTDIEYFPHSMHEPPHQMKLKVRAHMEKMKKIEYTYMVTGPYSDLFFGPMKERPEVGSFDVRRRKAFLLGDGEGPISFTTMADVGKYVVAALINHNASRNTTLIVHSFTATPNEILAEHEAQTGCKWDVQYVPLEKVKAMEKEAYQRYSPMATVLTLRRIWTEGGTLHKFYDDSMLGDIETQTLESQVERNIKKQRGAFKDDPQDLSLLRKLSAV